MIPAHLADPRHRDLWRDAVELLARHRVSNRVESHPAASHQFPGIDDKRCARWQNAHYKQMFVVERSKQTWT